VLHFFGKRVNQALSRMGQFSLDHTLILGFVEPYLGVGWPEETAPDA
jgi:hypothetical protein